MTEAGKWLTKQEQDFTKVEREFIRESLSSGSRAQRRRLVIMSAVAFLFSAGLAFFVWTKPSLWYAVSRIVWKITPEIQITEVPTGGQGGPDTTSKICGKVSGVRPTDFRVALYALTDKWYIQPTTSSLTIVNLDGKWCNVTHLGSSYAALLVLAGYRPPDVSETLPQTGDDVVSSTLVTATPSPSSDHTSVPQ